MKRTIPALVRGAVNDVPDKVWLHSDDGVLTFADAYARVERAASGLRERGVGLGDRVIITPRNTPDYLLSWFALMEVGAIQVPLNPKSSAGEVAGFVQQVAPALIVTDADLAPTVGAAVAEAGSVAPVADIADALRRRARRPRARGRRRARRRRDDPDVGHHRAFEARDADAPRVRDGG